MQMNFDWDTTTTGAFVDIDGDGVDDTVGDFTTTNGGQAKINHAYIELGGFRIGKTDSLFTTFTDYAGGVINDDIAVPFGPYRYPPDRLHLRRWQRLHRRGRSRRRRWRRLHARLLRSAHCGWRGLHRRLGQRSRCRRLRLGVGRVRGQGSLGRQGFRDDLALRDGRLQVG